MIDGEKINAEARINEVKVMTEQATEGLKTATREMDSIISGLPAEYQKILRPATAKIFKLAQSRDFTGIINEMKAAQRKADEI